MDFAPDIPTLQASIMTFAMTHAGDLPDYVAPKFAEAASKASPVDTIVSVAECLYANQGAMSAGAGKTAAQTLCAQCAAMAAQVGWHDMGTRGPAIVSAMRRNLGETAPEGQTWPDMADDPAPITSWTP